MFGGVFSWSNVLYERVYPGGDLLIQFVGRDAYKQFWNFSKDEKENLATQLAIELPALRGKVGASQEEIASAVGISRQTYSAYENRTRPIPWSLYLALLANFFPTAFGIFSSMIDSIRPDNHVRVLSRER